MWELLGALQRPHETQLQQETQQRGASPPPRPCPAEQLLRAQLDVPACQLLLAAASTSLGQLASAAPGEGVDRQARANRLRPLLRAAVSHCSGFALADFRVLLRLAAAARFVPDPEWLATLLYADTGGIERFYKAVRHITNKTHCALCCCRRFGAVYRQESAPHTHAVSSPPRQYQTPVAHTQHTHILSKSHT